MHTDTIKPIPQAAIEKQVGRKARPYQMTNILLRVLSAAVIAGWLVLLPAAGMASFFLGVGAGWVERDVLNRPPVPTWNRVFVAAVMMLPVPAGVGIGIRYLPKRRGIETGWDAVAAAAHHGLFWTLTAAVSGYAVYRLNRYLSGHRSDRRVWSYARR